MSAEKQVLNALERALGILSRYVEPDERDCERTVNELLDVLDRDEVVAAVDEMQMRGHAVDDLRRALDRGRTTIQRASRELGRTGSAAGATGKATPGSWNGRGRHAFRRLDDRDA
jgi:predicted transcriptional regulator